MERQSGEGDEDRISELPEALLLKILSKLPTETVMATSVLSKKWKFIWKKIPNLKFDSKYHQNHIFSKNVFYALKLHEAQVLESLHLTAGSECNRSEMMKCIVVAFTRKVRKLVMKLELEEEDEFVLFPPIVLKYDNTLEILKLEGHVVFFHLTSPVGLSSLRELHLYYVGFYDEESLTNLLSGCPKLQDLVVHQDSFVGVDTFTIAVPSLQRLTLAIDYFSENGGSYLINAPSLKRLYIKGFKNLDCCLIQNTPELVEAKITDVSNVRNENILESLVSAKRLSFWLSPLKIKYPAGKIFDQLLSLEMFVNEEDWWNLLSLMLVNSPKLQTLKLLNHLRFDKGPIGRKWNQPKCVPECLLFHLETFIWRCYAWEREDEKEVATYILKNARHLKKATFTTIKPIELEKMEERHEMLNQLGNEIRDRASDSCHVVFEFDTYGFLGREKDDDLDEFVY